MNTDYTDAFNTLIKQLHAEDGVPNLAELFVQHPELRKQRHTKILCEQRGCTLARLYKTTIGLVVYIPQYKLSPAENTRTSPSVREERTTDGDRRWKDHAYVLWDGWRVDLTCDHIRVLDLHASEVRRIADGEKDVVRISN